MFYIVEILFPVVFLLAVVMTVFTLVKGIFDWHKNNHSPRLTVSARIVKKRRNITHYSSVNYVTFQVESGDRMEMPVSNAEYAMLAEGDEGKLTFQGTRYLAFDR